MPTHRQRHLGFGNQCGRDGHDGGKSSRPRCAARLTQRRIRQCRTDGRAPTRVDAPGEGNKAGTAAARTSGLGKSGSWALLDLRFTCLCGGLAAVIQTPELAVTMPPGGQFSRAVDKPIFEADFAPSSVSRPWPPCSFGFRPKRGQHDALQVLTDETWRGRRWVVETECAGINRLGGGDGKALRRRSSDPRRLRVMRRCSRGCRRSVDRGTCRPGY
jgi:hypothetical protein